MFTETGHSRQGCQERGERARESGQPRGAASAARLIPSVTFGLRAAVLAGVVLVSCPGLPHAAAASASAPVLTTTMLGSPVSALGLDETTCCSGHNVSI
jgi:hypothetical protein